MSWCPCAMACSWRLTSICRTPVAAPGQSLWNALLTTKPVSNAQDNSQDNANTHEDFLEFVFDPANPVPTLDGALTSGDPVMFGGAFDQHNNSRDDVLVFQTLVLTEDLEVTGAIEAHLWISSDQPDTDFTVELIDVYPPSDDYPRGYAMNITDGILRVRYREGFDREGMMTPGILYKIVIEPFASSNFPHFDINPNTGAAAHATACTAPRVTLLTYW